MEDDLKKSNCSSYAPPGVHNCLSEIKVGKERRKFELDHEDEEDEKGGNAASRVTIEAIEFDWIFEERNCENFLMMLASHGNGKIFAKKSIKAFIELLWKSF